MTTKTFDSRNSEMKAVGNNMAVSINIFCFVVESLVHLVFKSNQITFIVTSSQHMCLDE